MSNVHRSSRREVRTPASLHRQSFLRHQLDCAERDGGLGEAVQQSRHRGKVMWLPGIILVEGSDQVPAGGPDAVIAGGRRASVARRAQHGDGVPARQLA